MATILNSKFNNCATCEFWSGQRPFVNSLHNAVKVDVFDKGDCLERRIKTSPKQSCPKWVKWGALKS